MPHRLGYPATWPPVAAGWRFGPGRRPVRPVWFPNRHPPERAPPYAQEPDNEWLRSHAPARPQNRAPFPEKVPTGARAQPDSTVERFPRAHPARSDSPEPHPEKMFPGASNQIALSTPGQYATLAEAARDSIGLCAHCRRARAERPALARSQAGGMIRNCRAPGELAWLNPTDWPPRPRNLRTPGHRFPGRSLDTRPLGKARTSGRPRAQRKRARPPPTCVRSLRSSRMMSINAHGFSRPCAARAFLFFRSSCSRNYPFCECMSLGRPSWKSHSPDFSAVPGGLQGPSLCRAQSQIQSNTLGAS